MEKKFTEGNWNVSDDTSECYLVKSDDGGLIAFVYDGDIDDEAIHMDVVQANAKLIAAAPGLIEACIKLKEWNDKYPPGRIYDYSQGKAIENELTSIVKMQFEAIKKATE